MWCSFLVQAAACCEVLLYACPLGLANTVWRLWAEQHFPVAQFAALGSLLVLHVNPFLYSLVVPSVQCAVFVA